MQVAIKKTRMRLIAFGPAKGVFTGVCLRFAFIRFGGLTSSRTNASTITVINLALAHAPTLRYSATIAHLAAIRRVHEQD